MALTILDGQSLRHMKLVSENNSYKDGTAPAKRGDKFAIVVVNGISTTIPQSVIDDKKKGLVAEISFTDSTKLVKSTDAAGIETESTVPGLQYNTSVYKAEVKEDMKFEAELDSIRKEFSLADALKTV